MEANPESVIKVLPEPMAQYWASFFPFFARILGLSRRVSEGHPSVVTGIDGAEIEDFCWVG
jgi:hypothetical protein